MRTAIKLLVGTTVILSFTVAAKDVHISKELQASMNNIATHTQVILVPDPGTTEAKFQEDSDPSTLEIVVLAKPSDGPDKVSADGEVIFVHQDTSDAKKQSMFATAFYLKAKAQQTASQTSNNSSKRTR